jgi:Ca2+-dependent lipid-binding protein
MGKVASALGIQSGAGPLNVKFFVQSAENIRSLENRALERLYFAVSVAGTGGSRAKTNDIPFNAGAGLLNVNQAMNLHCSQQDNILLQCYHDIRLLPDHLLGECYFPLQNLLAASGTPQWLTLQKNGQMIGRVLLSAAIEGPTQMGQSSTLPGQSSYAGQTGTGMGMQQPGMVGSTGTGVGGGIPQQGFQQGLGGPSNLGGRQY